MAVHVASMHWHNIAPAIRDGQRRVFDALGLPLQQHLADGLRHGVWMDRFVRALGANDTVVFFDIDAFPLNRAVYERALATAARGGVFGLAQTANHRPQTRLVPYAGPMFMAFSIATWQRLGRPSLTPVTGMDAGQLVSVEAQRQGVELDLLYPGACLQTKWPLGHKGVFGIGTFYGELDAFHLFESRKDSHVMLFEAVATDVAQGRPLDFTGYLQILEHDGKPPVAQAKGWRRWLARR